MPPFIGTKIPKSFSAKPFGLARICSPGLTRALNLLLALNPKKRLPSHGLHILKKMTQVLLLGLGLSSLACAPQLQPQLFPSVLSPYAAHAQDFSRIRHVYLNLDRSGDHALQTIHASLDIPCPNFVLHTSPVKHQVVWRIEGLGGAPQHGQSFWWRPRRH